jgi:thioredoxin-like negative regulator of GroEL
MGVSTSVVDHAAVYQCMRSHHLNAQQARALTAAGAPPALVIVVTPSCPACIWVMETLETMCAAPATGRVAAALKRMYTVDVATAATLWPRLNVERVPRAILLRKGAATLLEDMPLLTEADVRRLAQRAFGS